MIVFIGDLVSLDFLGKFYKWMNILCSYGCGSLMVEYGTVDPVTRVRSPPVALNIQRGGQ